jgi:hypothetical protein
MEGGAPPERGDALPRIAAALACARCGGRVVQRPAISRTVPASGTARRDTLNRLAGELDAEAARSPDAARVRALAGTVREMAGR